MSRSAVCLSLLVAACGADAPAATPDAAGPPSASLESDAGGGALSLRNASAACDQTPWTWAVQPDPGEHGWLVSRITPAHYPFAVEAIHHQLYTVSGCATPGPYRVRLARGPGATPPASPTSLFETTITPPAIAPGAKLSAIDTPLPTPIELQDGDSLFVMFEMQGDATDCIKSCQDGVVSLDHDWEGRQVDPPISWSMMSTADRPRTLDVIVDGHRP